MVLSAYSTEAKLETMISLIFMHSLGFPGLGFPGLGFSGLWRAEDVVHDNRRHDDQQSPDSETSGFRELRVPAQTALIHVELEERPEERSQRGHHGPDNRREHRPLSSLDQKELEEVSQTVAQDEDPAFVGQSVAIFRGAEVASEPSVHAMGKVTERACLEQ